MNLLAIDTATDACSAAIFKEGEVFSQFQIVPRQHSQLLFSMCNQILSSSQLDVHQLDAIAFGRGPGSFTGLRIASSFVQAIAFAHQLPVIKVSDLQIVAQMMLDKYKCSKVLSLINARIGETYYAVFQRNQAGYAAIDGEEGIATIKELAEFDYFTGGIGGNGLAIYADQSCPLTAKVCDPDILPDAKAILPLAIEKLERGETCSAEDAVPIYLHPAMPAPG